MIFSIFQDAYKDLHTTAELSFLTNTECMNSSRVNLTLEMNQPMKCGILEDFVHTSKLRECGSAIGYHNCKVINYDDFSGSCNIECQCEEPLDQCRVILFMNPYVNIDIILLSEIEFHY